jgi:hypothetical protein
MYTSNCLRSGECEEQHSHRIIYLEKITEIMDVRREIQNEIESFIKSRGDRVSAKKLSDKAHFLALSIQNMFSSGQYFKGKTQIPSLSKAVEAAKEARDDLLSLEKTRAGPVDTSGVNRGQAESEFIGNAAASTIMVFWCAHGLNGMSRVDAAKEVFQSSVTSTKLKNFDSFKHVLRQETQRYL